MLTVVLWWCSAFKPSSLNKINRGDAGLALCSVTMGWEGGGRGGGRGASLMHPTVSIGPHEISGSRDWTAAVILLGTSCFNIQIVICHPTPCWDCFSCLPSPPQYSPTTTEGDTTRPTAFSVLFVTFTQSMLQHLVQVLTSFNWF